MDRITINFKDPESFRSELARTIKELASELGEFYHMDKPRAMQYFINQSDGQKVLLKWLKEEKGIFAMSYEFKSDVNDELWAYGFVFDCSEGLTAAILKYCGEQK